MNTMIDTPVQTEHIGTPRQDDTIVSDFFKTDPLPKPGITYWSGHSTNLSVEAGQKVGLFAISIDKVEGSQTLIDDDNRSLVDVQSTLQLNNAESANTDRIHLLARKYAQKELSREESDRLEIVSERVRQLIPRVTTEDFEKLEDVAQQIKKFRKESNDLLEGLGLEKH